MNHKYVFPASAHWALTFFTDRLVFNFTEESNIANYVCCKAVLLFLLLILWKIITEHSRETMEILKYAGIYFIPLIFVLIFKLPQGFLSNDERLIFEEAVKLMDYTWFSYLTTWYYIVSLMLIPAWFGPILIKVLLQIFVCAYTVKRSVSLFGSIPGIFAYIPFLFFPVLAYTTSAHRIPVYFLLYAFMYVKLFYDMLEKKELPRPQLFGMMILAAVLTQWRTEGIYLAGLFPILLLIVYPRFRELKKAACLILVFFLIQYIISIPQNGALPGRMGDKANNRMAPFYAYTITNMMRNGLDREKNGPDLEKVGRYLDLRAIDRINEDLKDINYEDVLILYYPGYTGVKEDVTPEDYNAYTEGCMNIFKNNPGVFFVTRCGAFDYAALPYKVGTDSDGIRGLAKLIFSIVKAGFYDLYIPCVLLILGWLLSVIRRNAFFFFGASGLIAHYIIVFVLAPASYFKYYFPIYFTVYLFYVLMIIKTLGERLSGQDKSRSPEAGI